MTPIDRDIKRLSGIYKAASRKIARILLSIKVSPFQEIAALRASQEVGRVIRGLQISSARWAKTAFKRQYRERMERDKIRLRVLGFESSPGASRLHAQSVNDLISATLKDLNKALDSLKKSADLFIHTARLGSKKVKTSIQQFDEEDLAEALEVFDGWMVEAVEIGVSGRKLAKLIEDYLAGMVDEGGSIVVNGRTFDLAYYAELVARTKLREAQTEATKRMCQEYDNDLVEFSTHAKPCEECAELEGQVFSLSGNDPVYPPLTDDVTPPIHPNCGHSISPTSRIGIEIGTRYSEAYEETI